MLVKKMGSDFRCSVFLKCIISISLANNALAGMLLIHKDKNNANEKKYERIFLKKEFDIYTQDKAFIKGMAASFMGGDAVRDAQDQVGKEAAQQLAYHPANESWFSLPYYTDTKDGEELSLPVVSMRMKDIHKTHQPPHHQHHNTQTKHPLRVLLESSMSPDFGSGTVEEYAINLYLPTAETFLIESFLAG